MNRFYKSKAYVISKFSIPSETLDQYLQENPDLLIKTDGGEYVNIGMKKFRVWANGKKSCSRNNQLETKAIEADLKAKIHKAEIKRIQAERENIELQKTRNDLISHAFAKFYYESYCEKINLELFRCDKKLVDFVQSQFQQKVTPEYLHDFIVEFKKIFENEIGSTLKAIQQQQQKEIEELKSENI